MTRIVSINRDEFDRRVQQAVKAALKPEQT